MVIIQLTSFSILSVLDCLINLGGYVSIVLSFFRFANTFLSTISDSHGPRIIDSKLTSCEKVLSSSDFTGLKKRLNVSTVSNSRMRHDRFFQDTC